VGKAGVCSRLGGEPDSGLGKAKAQAWPRHSQNSSEVGKRRTGSKAERTEQNGTLARVAGQIMGVRGHGQDGARGH
jgi:hypothetical protein